MKRTIALLSSLIMVLSLCACGGESTDSNTNASKDGSVYKLGDTIETDLFKITPSFTGYAKRLSNQPNEDYMTPAGYFTDDSPYCNRRSPTATGAEVNGRRAVRQRPA